MKNIMIDIETLGTASNSVILSIGAVSFNDDELIDEFYVDIDIDSCQDAGLKIDGRTLNWWMGQNDKARQVFSREGMPLDLALTLLNDTFNWADTLVWANGTNFDLPILDSAYRACNKFVPWAYYDARDYRTLRYQLSNETFNSLRVKPAVEHNALEDAKAQALTLMAMWDWAKSQKMQPA